jgi:hypothetical protein
MRTLILLAVVVQAVLGGGSHFSVRLPFLNPAGVTYVDGPAPAGLAAGPLQYAAEVGYAAAAPAAVGYAAPAAAAVASDPPAPAAQG